MKLKSKLTGLLLAGLCLPFLMKPDPVRADEMLPPGSIASNYLSPKQMMNEYNSVHIALRNYRGAVYDGAPSHKHPYRGARFNSNYVKLAQRHLNFYRKLSGLDPFYKMTSSQDIANVALIQSLFFEQTQGISHFPVLEGFRKPADMSESFFNKYAKHATNYHNILSVYYASWYTPPGIKEFDAINGYLNEGISPPTLGHRYALLRPRMTRFDFGGDFMNGHIHTAGMTEGVATPAQLDKDIYPFPAPGSYPVDGLSAGDTAWGFWFNPERISVSNDLKITIRRAGDTSDVFTGFVNGGGPGNTNRIHVFDNSYFAVKDAPVYGVTPRYHTRYRYPAGLYTVRIDGLIKNGKKYYAKYQVRLVDDASVNKIPTPTYTWFDNEGRWGYYNDKGKVHRGWLKLGKYRYFMDRSGKAVTGWANLDGKRFHFNQRGRADVGFRVIGNRRYYFLPGRAGGALLNREGWHTIRGKRYYVSKSGVVRRGYFTKGNDQWMLDSRTGEALWGFRRLKGKLYYFDVKDSRRAMRKFRGWKTIGNKRYYFNDDHSVNTKTLVINGKTYRFDSSSGELIQSRHWKTEGGKTYYLDPVKGRVKGWLKLDGKRYYLDPKTGERYHGIRNVEGKLYYFSSAKDGGALIERVSWQNIGKKRYFFNRDHSLRTGVLKGQKGQYYLDPKTGAMHRGILTKDYRHYMYHPTTGRLLTKKGWHVIDGLAYYVKHTGELRVGFYSYQNRYYYLNTISGKFRSGSYRHGNKLYTLSPNMNSPWVTTVGMYRRKEAVHPPDMFYFEDTSNKPSAYTYFFDRKQVLHTGWKTVKDKKYYFSADGIAVYGIYRIPGEDKFYYFGTDKDPYMRKYTGYHTVEGYRYYFLPDHSIKMYKETYN